MKNDLSFRKPSDRDSDVSPFAFGFARRFHLSSGKDHFPLFSRLSNWKKCPAKIQVRDIAHDRTVDGPLCCRITIAPEGTSRSSYRPDINNPTDSCPGLPMRGVSYETRNNECYLVLAYVMRAARGCAPVCVVVYARVRRASESGIRNARLHASSYRAQYRSESSRILRREISFAGYITGYRNSLALPYVFRLPPPPPPPNRSPTCDM